jgi:hypothetical protein
VYEKHFESLFMSYLTNSAAAVRVEGVSRSAQIASKFGSEWVMTSFVPKVNESYNAEK